jgi:hypothetical protein
LPIAVAVVSTLNVRFLVNGASNYADKPQVVAADGRAAANQRSDRLLTQQSHEVILVMRKHSVADHIATKNNLQASVETTRRLSTNIVDAPKRGLNEVCMPGLFRARRA